MQLLFMLSVALLGFVSSVSYEGYKTYNVFPKTQTEVEKLSIFRNNKHFDFWSQVRMPGLPVTIMVSPERQNMFTSYLKARQIEFKVQIENVETTIQAERLRQKLKPKLQKGRITFDQYLRHDEINAYLDELAENYPDLVTVDTIGTSYENRNLNAIRISTGGDQDKPKIFVDAGIHAREWIAPATALYLINQLVEVPENSYLTEDVDWVIWPSVNPDGYEYSQDEDRLWRKTRSKGKTCDGVDGNRNFDFHWMESGASDYECDETYAGPEALSEVEAQALANYVLSLSNVHVYLTLHSYGQYLLYPWGYDLVYPDNHQELDDLGHAVNDAIKAVRGTEYTVGSSTEVLYAAAGASDDWSMGVANISLVYTIELPGGGWYGFDLPESEILGVVTETFEGFKAYHDYVAQQNKNNIKH